MYIFEDYSDVTPSTSYPTVSGGIPLIFENCSSYQNPHDDKYAECDLSSDKDPCEYLKVGLFVCFLG
uniref:Uncharacterized protein n=1 Tax=Panagrolaimus davidi TaxID=227884 RepID=A0A914QN57_9BILA